MSFPFIFPKYRKPFKVKVKEAIITAIILVIVILCVYLYLDSNVSRDYITSDSMLSVDTSYKSKFEKLVKKVEDGMQTGIPSHDDSGVVYGDTIEITKGVGDFVNLTNPKGPIRKSYTSINSYTKWDRNVTGPFLLNGHLLKNCTMYEPGGIVKLFDRYIFTAVGTYWSKAFGLSADRGVTYRITLDNGNYYDIIVVDTKSYGDLDSVKSPEGESIGHDNAITGVCLTEFYRININDKNRYPVRPQIGKRPGVDYASVIDVKKVEYPASEDVTSILMGDFSYSTPYKGEIVSVQQIKDPKVEQVLKDSTEAYKNDLKTIYAGGNFIYK